MKENMMETVINTTAKKKKIFFLAFLIEVVSCFLFYRYDYHWTKILRYLCLTGFMLVLAVIDHEKSIVPNKLLVAMLVIRAVLLVIEVAVYPVYWKEKMISAVGGMLVGLILFLLAYVLSRKSIGLGDVKLAAVLGWYLGLSLIWWDLVAGLLLAGIYSVVQLARKKLSMKDSIPLVPFLAAGTILILLLGF
jgi:prepilin signal peptidase PulO-like enzyme (type II secretory pathway)